MEIANSSREPAIDLCSLVVFFWGGGGGVKFSRVTPKDKIEEIVDSLVPV